MTTTAMLLEMSLKEYELLRAEVVTTVERQYSLANWSISAVAVTVAAIIGGWQTITSFPALTSIVLVLIIPSIMTAYAISWSHTITKLNQLGARLYEIEENIAQSCGAEAIRKAFNIQDSEEIHPYRYTIGWEHALWKNGINNRIQTTIRVVGMILAIFYLFVIVGNGVYMDGAQVFSSRMVWVISLSFGFLWGVIWFVIFRYLNRRTIDASLPNHCLHTDAVAPQR
jgi:ABC-type multidrug transport system fused ATPase/permease subunit